MWFDLESIVGVKPDKTVLLFKNESQTLYKVIAVSEVNNTVQLNKQIAIDLAVDDVASERVPDDLKIAAAAIIEDRLTFEPNANRFTEELADLLKTRVARINDDMLPVDAIGILSKYRQRSFRV